MGVDCATIAIDRHLDLTDPSVPDQIGLLVRPGWRANGTIERIGFTEGKTNTLIRLVHHPHSATDSTAKPEDGAADSIMLRVYGAQTDRLIDRERELRVHEALSAKGLAPKLLARFRNGVVYEYVPGRACVARELSRPDIASGVARLLARWHSMDLTALSTSTSSSPIPRKDTIWGVIDRWVACLVQLGGPGIDNLEKEAGWLEQWLDGRRRGRMVFAHCDLLCGNVILVDDNDQVTAVQVSSKKGEDGDGKKVKPAKVAFIDYEYACAAPIGFELANHFAEWGGFECDLSLRPTDQQRRRFVSDYVDESRRMRSSPISSTSSSPSPSSQQQPSSSSLPPSPPPQPSFSQPPSTLSDSADEVDRLLAEIDDHDGMQAFFWALWAMVQDRTSAIDFDYASYAAIRMGEYDEWKRRVTA